MDEENYDLESFVRANPPGWPSKLYPIAKGVFELRARGYTFVQIASWAEQCGVKVTASTVRHFICRHAELMAAPSPAVARAPAPQVVPPAPQPVVVGTEVPQAAPQAAPVAQPDTVDRPFRSPSVLQQKARGLYKSDDEE